MSKVEERARLAVEQARRIVERAKQVTATSREILQMSHQMRLRSCRQYRPTQMKEAA